MQFFSLACWELAGALDAQARIARRAYNISRPPERSVNFRRLDFKKALAAHEAKSLYTLMAGGDFEALATLVYTLRNTIHGAGAKDLVKSESEGMTGYTQVSEKDGNALWQAAEVLGGPEKWGLIWSSYTLLKPPNTETQQVEEYLVEPYTFSSVLVQESYKAIDKVAELTDIRTG